MIPTFVCCSGIARMAFGVASDPVPAVAGINNEQIRRCGCSPASRAVSEGASGCRSTDSSFATSSTLPADTNDHLRLAGAQLADDLRNIVMVGLSWHAVNDLNFTPFSRQQAMNRPGCLQRPDVLVGHQQD